MYREQAVEIIERHIDNNIASGSLVEQALRMAIKALKAQLHCEGTTKGTTPDMISRQAAIDLCDWYDNPSMREDLEKLPPAQPNLQPICNQLATDTISRQAEIDGKISIQRANGVEIYFDEAVPVDYLKRLQPIQLEPLTDKEQRIFLAAMGREEKVCEEVDRNYVREPYEDRDSLMRVCKEIRRKVKGALWT